jgi:hypothetical protein
MSERQIQEFRMLLRGSPDDIVGLEADAIFFRVTV